MYRSENNNTIQGIQKSKKSNTGENDITPEALDHSMRVLSVKCEMDEDLTLKSFKRNKTQLKIQDLIRNRGITLSFFLFLRKKKRLPKKTYGLETR